MGEVLIVLLTGVILLLVIAWLGLRWAPKSFPPWPPPPAPPAPAAWPEDLPPPVRRAFAAVLPNGPVEITTAVISGRAALRVNGIPLRARFRFIHQAGRSYRHAIEVTWFNRPILKIDESFVDGYPRMALGPLGKFEGTSTLFQAATLALWAESIWLPPLLISGPRVRWQAVDDTHARLFVPAGEEEEELLVTFDAGSGRIAAMDAQRYRDAGEDAVKLGWRCLIGEYAPFGGLLSPRQSSLQWSDQQRPWAEWTVEEVVYNADVNDTLRATGP